MLGLNPVDDSVDSVMRVLHRFHEIKTKHTLCKIIFAKCIFFV
ncbi:MAG: hypothetical protein ACFN23_09190 [Capnocytophaga gingivalis]